MADFKDGELYVCVEFGDGADVSTINDSSHVVFAADILNEIADFYEVAPIFSVYRLVKVADVDIGKIVKETA